jgi:hypothetical protein
MDIEKRALTLNQNVANQTVDCIAGCHVKLEPGEIASLGVPGNPGFTLTCVLEGVDRGPDTVLFTFPTSRTFLNLLDIGDVDEVFTGTVSSAILNEDGQEADEIRAVFTLVNNSTGISVIRRSANVQVVL